MSGRGRGKRIANTTATATVPTTTTTHTTVPSNTEVPENKTVLEKSTKKPSKKKQFPVIAVVGPDGIEGNLLPEQKRPLIVHLRIQSKYVPINDMPITYDPAPPNEAQPYDINADDPFYEGVEQFDNQVVIPHDVSQPSKLEITQLEQSVISTPVYTSAAITPVTATTATAVSKRKAKK